MQKLKLPWPFHKIEKEASSNGYKEVHFDAADNKEQFSRTVWGLDCLIISQFK